VGKKILSKLLKAKKREERNRKKNISKSKKKKKLLKVVKKRREEELRRIQELERTRAKLEALIAKFKKYPIKELGHIIWPVRGEVVSRFGTIVDPKLGTKLINKGIDIKAPYGSNVAAIHNGKISYEGQFLGYGKLIIVDHENGFSSLYAYLSEILVSEGDKVKQGEIIGRVGNSGLAEESILHFEIRKNGVAVDPLRWLK
jgi:murein DD-endopeptidase MepM/ murein hydrolase activator NlpD